MATFPSALYSWVDRVDNTDDNNAADVNALAAEIIALQTKLGIDDSAVATSIDYLLKNRDAGIPFVIDGGGAVITTGIKGDQIIPWNGTIQSVTMLADQSGSIVVDIWVDTYANYPPTDADSITAAAPPTITTAVKSQDATLTGWTKGLTKGKTIRYNVDSCSSITRCLVFLQCTKSS